MLKLTETQEKEFEKLVEEKQFLMRLALYKTNIAKHDHEDFYNYALEGLLVSYIIAQKDISIKQDFDKYALTVMKRKIIDEIRRRNRQKAYGLYDEQNTLQISDKGYQIVKIDFFNSIKGTLTEEEKLFFTYFLKTGDIKKTAKILKIGKSKAYELLESVKEKCQKLLKK